MSSPRILHPPQASTHTQRASELNPVNCQVLQATNVQSLPVTPSQRSNLLAATYRGENPTLWEQMAMSCETANQSMSAAIQQASKRGKPSGSGVSTLLNSTYCCSSRPATMSKQPSRLFREDTLPSRMR